MSGHTLAVWIELGLAVITALALLFVTAPYGRHQRGGWGSTISARAGWVIMESPAVLWFGAVYAAGDHRGDTVPLILFAMWQWHYLQRTLIFPLRMRASGKRTPLLVVGLAIGFNLLNGYVNARWISQLGRYSVDWLSDPRFIAGAGLFAAGWWINVRADRALFRLRGPGESGYAIPRGGLYELVSCPNYLGETLEWCGWALATWSFAGLAFAVYTAANLVPRALDHHRWYRDRFADYPAPRKAIIPFVL